MVTFTLSCELCQQGPVLRRDAPDPLSIGELRAAAIAAAARLELLQRGGLAGPKGGGQDHSYLWTGPLSVRKEARLPGDIPGQARL